MGNKETNGITRSEMWDALCIRHSEEVQNKLAQARVAVAGLGGLGSMIAVCLARAGVGHLLLVDFDRVDLTNLNRQQYAMRHVGMPKAQAMKQILAEINPWLDVQSLQKKVTRENAGELFAGVDYICEAFDRAEQKAMLVNTVLEEFPHKTVIAASGMAGYGKSNLIRTRRITDTFWLCGDETSESVPQSGLMAPRVAICGAHQANLVLELIIKEGKETYDEL